jgi:hypothetical protein
MRDEQVADRTDQPSNRTSLVIVIDSKSLSFWGFSTDQTLPLLRFEHL